MLALHAAEAYELETGWQNELLAEIGPQDERLVPREPSPTTVGFRSFIKDACAHGTFLDGLAAVTECPWVYRELARGLAGAQSPDPHYQRWLDLYTGAEMDETVEASLAVLDRVAAEAGEAELRSACAYAEQAVRWDLAFWDAAYRDQRWPGDDPV